MQFAWANVENFEKADVVIIGVPDESASRALRKGASKAPDRIRKISNEREVFERKKIKVITLPGVCPLEKRIFDHGNVKKKDISKIIEKIVSNGKIPVTIGGDHSITAEILKGIDKVKKNVSIVYFDAHPDFICSSKQYYGSVVCDILDYKNINFDSSIEIGLRAPEPEELINIRRKHLKTIASVDVVEKGLQKVVEEVKERVEENIYISIDMDVVDPAFAPGVSTPAPAGLLSNQLIYLLKEVSKLGIIGFDIMEVCPAYDIQDMTSHLAARIIIETISCMTCKIS